MKYFLAEMNNGLFCFIGKTSVAVFETPILMRRMSFLKWTKNILFLVAKSN